MAKMLNWNPGPAMQEIVAAGMNRMEEAAHIMADEARRILASKLKGNWQEHGPYKSGASWTARQKGAMVKTIRVVKKPGVNNIWIMAGNYDVWWAIQMEYGHGEWRGGARSFMRPALKATEQKIQAALASGAYTSKGEVTYKSITGTGQVKEFD